MSSTQTEGTIALTDNAIAKIAELIQQEGNPDLALRVAVRPGGMRLVASAPALSCTT